MNRMGNSTVARRRFLIAFACVSLAPAVFAQGSANVRRLPLEGAPNVRDIGGYATADGRHVKWRQVYRAGALGRLTDKDYAYLAGLGISVICDFRRDDERRAAPTVWRGSTAPELLTVPAMPGPASGMAGPSARELIARGASPAEVAGSMRSSYEQYIVSFAPSYGTVLQRILRGSGPTLYHCSAGKDRTGVFSALLLLMLGVPRATVYEDYLLTNQYVGTDERVAAMAQDLKGSADAVRPLLLADPTYLDSALGAIDRMYGSFDNYRRTALKLSDADLEGLKARLLER